MDQAAWEGPERRQADRRGCDWPSCNAKTDADEKHKELREDLNEIKLNQRENNAVFNSNLSEIKGNQKDSTEEFKRLATALEQILTLKRDVGRLEEEHDKDIAEVKVLITNNISEVKALIRAVDKRVDDLRDKGASWVWDVAKILLAGAAGAIGALLTLLGGW